MKKYSSTITLVKTSRGVYGLDTVKGCKYGMFFNKKGCYSACYANSIAERYGYDFSNSTIRRFETAKHEEYIVESIKSISADFVRMGIMGDPSECWGHTIEICNKISKAKKQIVLITKHWESIPEYLYGKVKQLGLIINTSVSALDNDLLIRHRLSEYNKLKNICTSVLRIVSCDFNKNSIYGIALDEIQQRLFDNKNVIDTILRVTKNHELVESGIISTSNINFLSSRTEASIYNSKTHFGYCGECNEKCGVCFK